MTFLGNPCNFTEPCSLENGEKQMTGGSSWKSKEIYTKKGTSQLTRTVEKTCGSWVHNKPTNISQPGLLQNGSISNQV